MRFKKGCSVEVFSEKEVPTGAWFCAEIISGNGRTYSIKYKHLSNNGESLVERVPRKAIRPCPPPVKRMNDWVPGDIAEAFHNFSWKMARIVKVMDEKRFFVSILGLSTGCFHKAYLRVRQCWQDDKWFVIGKGSGIAGMSMVKSNTKESRKPVGDESSHMEKNSEHMPCVIVKGALKRKSQDLGAHPFAAQKKRLIEKGCSHQQIYSMHRSPTSEKVDAVVYPDVVLGENHTNSSFNFASAESFFVDTSCRTNGFVIDCTSEDTDSCASSTGSCYSFGNNAENVPFRCSIQHGNNSDDYFSDAESSSSGMRSDKEECSPYSGNKKRSGLCRSRLDTYRLAIEDLYALGPLSWEDEAKLTNLRHVLHISDDEHLTVLRNLISANRVLLVG